MLDTILDSPLSQWLCQDTEATDHIVISSRIRLARNFDDILFTNREDTVSLEKVNTISRGLLPILKKADEHQYTNISLEQLSQCERAVLVEKHLMSPALEEELPYRNLIVSDDASIVIMVNEEDHLRIQSMAPGLKLQQAYNHAVQIDKAIEAFYKSKNPNIRIIASGGKGNDEKISEAQAIANYIEKETTVPTDRIILEDKSTTTYENLLFSKKIGESLIENPKFLFVTNNYHVYRTGAYAKKVGMVGDGLGCRTARYYIPSAFIREFIALCVKIKWVFAAFYAILISGLFLSYGYLLF